MTPRLSVLNGSMPKRCPETFEEFVGDFVDGITDEEWAHLAAMPVIPWWTTFVAVVVALRGELAWEIADPEHPLQSAATVAARAS